MNLSEQKFKILALFKKIYLETKSGTINENLIKYVKKFQNYEKLQIKPRPRSNFRNRSILLRSISTVSKF